MPKRLLVLAVSSALALAGCQGQRPVGALLPAQLVLPPVVAIAPTPAPVAIVDTGAGPVSPDAGSGHQAPPTRHGGSSGGGGTAAPTGPTFTGLVLGIVGQVEKPLAGATVVTTDGRSASTDAQGQFKMPGDFPADGGFVASRAGYVASAVAGLVEADGAPTLHLKTAAIPPAPAQPVLERLTTSGHVVAPDGSPQPGLTVVFESASGAFSAPAVTDDFGAFSLVVFAPGGRVADGTVIAVGDATHPWMGLATNVALDAQTTELDMDPGGGQALEVLAATHPVTLALDATQAEAVPTVSFDIRGPGASLSIPLDNGAALVADVPGATFSLRADAINAANGTTSRVVHEAIAIDFNAPTTAVTATMLQPPDILTATNLAPGEVVSWSPVTGATAYSLSLAGLDAQGFLWESFATGPSAALRFAGGALAAGNYGLTITAWDDASLTPRSVAAIGPTRLRLLPLATVYRQSSRQLRRSLS